MVAVVVNNVPINANPTNLNITHDLLQEHDYLFTNPDDYHPYCPVDYSNATSAEFCWLGDTSLALMDVDTELPEVISTYETWIKEFVSEYSIDGLRIDAAKHVQESFWPGFCGAAGVYCIGEVFAEDIPYVLANPPVLGVRTDIRVSLFFCSTCVRYADKMDGIMNYPVYYGMMDAFQLPGPSNISSLVEAMTNVNESLPVRPLYALSPSLAPRVLTVS